VNSRSIGKISGFISVFFVLLLIFVGCSSGYDEPLSNNVYLPEYTEYESSSEYLIDVSDYSSIIDNDTTDAAYNDNADNTVYDYGQNNTETSNDDGEDDTILIERQPLRDSPTENLTFEELGEIIVLDGTFWEEWWRITATGRFSPEYWVQDNILPDTSLKHRLIQAPAIAMINHLSDTNEISFSLRLGNSSIENFDFLANYDNIRRLDISGGTIYSFDYFTENLTNLQALLLHSVNVHQDAGPIPYIADLSNLSITGWRVNEVEANDFQTVFELIVNNSHTIRLGLGFDSSTYYTNRGTVHVTLEPLSKFVNMELFDFLGYATTLDVSALKNATSLVEIWMTSRVDTVLNLQCLAYLPNLERLTVPPHEWENPALDLLNDDVNIINRR